MTDHATNTKPIVRSGAFLVLAWTLAWGVMGAALYLGGIFNSPRTGPLWLALAGGALSWSLAGAFTFPAGRQAPSPLRKIAAFVIWALAYFASFGLAAFLTSTLADTLGGLLFVLIGWSIGPGAAAFASTWLLTGRLAPGRAGLVAAIWILGFSVGSYLGFMAAYLGAELLKILIGSLVGVPAALVLGFASGCALGGLAASWIAIPLTRRLIGSRPEAHEKA